MKKIILTIVISMLFWNTSSSQQTDWINYTYAYGLWDFAETNYYYYLSTLGGLVKIKKTDNSIEVLTKANSPLSYNSVGPLCVDSQGNLWIGSLSNNSQEGGLIKYDGENWEAVDLEDGFWSTNITGLTADKNDNLWFGMGQGIAKYDGSNVEYKQIISDLMPFGLSLKKILFDSNNNVWFLDEPGIIRVLKEGNFDSLKGVVSTPWFEQDIAGDFWIVYNNTLKCFSGVDNVNNLVDGGTVIVNDKLLFKDSIMPQFGDTIRYFHIDNENNFYISFQSKMGIFKNGNWQYLTFENSQLPDGSFNNLFADKSGNLWANIYIPNERFRIYKYNSSVWLDVTQQMSNSGLHDNYITHFAKDDSNEKWMVCYSKEDVLTNFDGTVWTDFDGTSTSVLDTRFTLKYTSDSLKIWNDNSIIISYNIHNNEWSTSDNRPSQSAAMKIDQSGNIWWGTNKGLLKYNGSEWETIFKANYIYSLCFDNSLVLYASTLSSMEEPGVILKYENNVWDTLATCSGDAKWVPSMVFDNNNNLWFGVLYRGTVGHEYGDGLYKYDGQNFTPYHIYNSDMPGNSVVYVTTDIDNNICVGTYGDGLSILKENNWINYNASNSPLSGISVEKIMPDNNGNIWAYCQYSGITVIPYPYTEFNGTGIENSEFYNLNDNVRVYPNPTSGDLNLSFKVDKPSLVSIIFYNVSGKRVLSLSTVFYTGGTHNENLNQLESLSKGVYFCEIIIDNKKVIKKVILE